MWVLGKKPVDTEASREGAWVAIGDGSVEVRVRPLTNRDFTRAYEARLKPYRRQLAANSLSGEIMTKAMCESLAHHVLLDWRGPDGEDENGRPVPRGIPEQDDDGNVVYVDYSTEEAIRLLTEYYSFMSEVMEAARDEANFTADRDAQDAEDLGNE